MLKILFVCLGNICRSPMAEAVFKDLLEKEGLTDRFQVASAATSHWEAGNPPHSGTQKILASHGISVKGMSSTSVVKDDFHQYDLILGMDRNNVKDLLGRAPAGTEDKVRLFLSEVPNCHYEEVPDPYYTGDFQLTYDLVSKGCQAWLDKCLK